MTTRPLSRCIDLDLSPLAGDYASDYDWDGTRTAYAAELSDLAGPGVTVTASGVVYVEADEYDRACDIDWAELAELVDGSALLAAHEVTTADVADRVDDSQAAHPDIEIRLCHASGHGDWHVLAATQWASDCGGCGQPITTGRVGLATWCDEHQHQHGGYNHQHGCGEWNTPTEVQAWYTAAPDEADLDALIDRLGRDLAAERQSAAEDVHEQLRTDLRTALAERADLLVDGVTAEEADAEITTGGETGPGVWHTDGQWEAWDYDPRTTPVGDNDDGACAELIIVTEADL